MADALRKISLYDDLLSLPDSITGEILNGQLYGHPRPSGKHVAAASNLSIDIGGAYHRGRGGPGGWWILSEPEIHFKLDEEVVVPDLAGWKRDRMPSIPDSHKFTVIPDWACEIISPSTESIDWNIKKPLYASYGVRYLWMVDPKKRRVWAFALRDKDWVSLGEYAEGDVINIEPFIDISINVSELLE